MVHRAVAAGNIVLEHIPPVEPRENDTSSRRSSTTISQEKSAISAGTGPAEQKKAAGRTGRAWMAKKRSDATPAFSHRNRLQSNTLHGVNIQISSQLYLTFF
jgi:hypothetical protein